MGTQWMAEVLRKKDTNTNTTYLTERDGDLTWKEIFVKQELTRVVVQKCRFCGTRHLYQLRTEPVSLKATKADWDGKMMECTVCSIPFPSHDSSQPKSQPPSIIWITRETSHIQHWKKREIPVDGQPSQTEAEKLCVLRPLWQNTGMNRRGDEHK